MSLEPLRQFVTATTEAVAASRDEAVLLQRIAPLLRDLVSRDDWLPDELAQPHPEHYQQFLLHADPLGRFSVVSFVWGPGQKTPVHDHTVWGLIGMLRGQEIAQPYRLAANGLAQLEGEPTSLKPGQVEAVSPTIGDVHQVRNAFDDRTSISIHVYGGNIGAVQRWVYPPEGGRKGFVSGYSNHWVPNLWHAQL